jgi:uncharacterized protein (TIGR02421 family)
MTHTTADDSFQSAIALRLGSNRRVRRPLPGGGRIHVDRLLPFLCVYQWPIGEESSGLQRLAMTQAAYLVAPNDAAQDDLITATVEAIAGVAVAAFGGFLVIELTERPWRGPQPDPAKPEFSLWRSKDEASGPTAEAIAESLREVHVHGEPARVAFETKAAFPGGSRLQTFGNPATGKRAWIGIGVAPIHRDSQGAVFPQVLLELETGMCEALLAGCFEFTRRTSIPAPQHRHELGRRAIVRSAWHVDHHLAHVANSFEFLRLVTPWNVEDVWQEFARGGFRRVPRFRYHRLPIDPQAIKRTLYGTPIENVEDVTLARLYRERQEELDCQITMLSHRGSERFLYGSLQLYGGVEDELREQALALLKRVPAAGDEVHANRISARDLVGMAQRDIATYRSTYRSFKAQIEMRADIVAGAMVSNDRLLISPALNAPPARADALLQHEVGTHLLTYFNGRAQRLRLLYVGLAGYEAFQEGLAVLAEYLVGGLDRWRLRVLAGRVLACRALVDGASIEESFDALTSQYGFTPHTAFTIAARVHRGGGLTKDAIYLRGLQQALHHLATCDDVRLLFAGKIGGGHVAIMQELKRRGVLSPIPLLPNYFERPEAKERLQRIRGGLTLSELVAQVETERAA